MSHEYIFKKKCFPGNYKLENHIKNTYKNDFLPVAGVQVRTYLIKKTLKQGLQGTLANKRHRPRRPLATKLQHTFRLCPCSLFGKLAVIQFGNPILPDGPGNKLLRGQAMWPRS